MRKKIIAGNWKMNLTFAEAMSLAHTLADAVDENTTAEIILAAPNIYLHELLSRIQSSPSITIAAQNCSDKEKGALTGETSASMLASIGVEHVLIGHSERRQFFNETDSMLAGKVTRTIENGLIPVFCCGEKLDDRAAGNHFDVVASQLTNGLFHIREKDLMECIIAYEPVWAIGTGENASAEQAEEMHAFIRKHLATHYTEELSQIIPVIYGGSVTAQNAEELFNCPNVDGGLVGGASLKADEFISIIGKI